MFSVNQCVLIIFYLKMPLAFFPETKRNLKKSNGILKGASVKKKENLAFAKIVM